MKILYILNVATRVNNFSYTSMLAAKEIGLEFQIAGNWGYKSDVEREDDEKKYGIKIHQVDFIRIPFDPRNVKAYKQVVEIINKESIDIIHCNTPIGGLIGRLAGVKCGINKVIYQVHGFHFYKGAPPINWLIYYPIEKWLAKYTDKLITINKEDFKLAKDKFYLRKSGKIYYVPGVGIDANAFSNQQEIREKKREELSISKDSIVLISVGELNENKNNKVVVNALGKLNNDRIHYLLCGKGTKKRELEQIAYKHGIRDRVHFLGFRNDIKELYATADIFVMSSYREGLSRSIMEAMASGLPCVVSDIRGNRDLIIDGEEGYLCGPSNVESFRDKIDILSKDYIARSSMSEAVLKKIVEFNNDTVIGYYKEIYENIVYE